jgi:hypothetical protein
MTEKVTELKPEELSIEQLKALGYDEMQRIEINQRNLRIIQNELRRRQECQKPIEMKKAEEIKRKTPED